MRPVGLVVLGIIVAFSLCGLPGTARACGGGVVTTELDSSVGDAQRVVMSIHGDVTDIVVQIRVPQTTADYGVLLPEPYEPTLDPNPVSATELDALDEQTAPQIFVESDEGGGGCGCGSLAGDAKGVPTRGVASEPVDIGPVTAVVLTAADGADVRAWLGENGFALREADLALVDEYSGPGRYFIAIKRNQAAATGAATSIGVHFTLPVAHAELPLRFARLGAASKVTFNVFLFATRTLVPAAPFETVTLDGLSGALIRQLGYAAAVEAASARDGGRGFVLEGTRSTSELDFRLQSLVQRLGARDMTVTRLATILERSALDEDAHFTETFEGDAPRERTLSSTFDVSRASAAAVWLLLLLRRPARRRAPRAG